MLAWWNSRHGSLKSYCPRGRVGANPTVSTLGKEVENAITI